MRKAANNGIHETSSFALTRRRPLFIRVRGRCRGRGGDQATQQAPPPQQAAAPPTLQLTLGEYKTVNGIKLPHLITRGAGGQTIEEWTVKSYKLNPSFKSDVFSK